MATSAGTVAVTGASGFIAGHCIRQLQEAGYTVKGSVRDLTNEYKCKHLQADFPGLELFEADLLTEGSFDAGFAGCDFVLHTASPFQLSVEDPQRDLVDPAVKGTLNVLNAAKKAGVKKVVVTSSCAAVSCESFDPETVHTEEHWNTDSTLESGAYRLSKTLAERAAYEFAESAEFELATINPSSVLGPPTSSRTDSTSVAMVKKLLEGAFKDGCPPAGYGCVDVHDVALAHVRALQRDEAKGRFLVTSNLGVSMLSLADALRAEPTLSAFHANLPTAELKPSKLVKYSHAKAESVLGIEFRTVESAVADMGKYLLENSIISA